MASISDSFSNLYLSVSHLNRLPNFISFSFIFNKICLSNVVEAFSFTPEPCNVGQKIIYSIGCFMLEEVI